MAEDYITAMSDWLKKRNISDDVVKTLVKEGYTSMEALAMLTGEDITDINAGRTQTQKIPQGQHKLLLHVVVQLRSDESPATKQDPYVAMMEQFKQKQQVRVSRVMSEQQRWPHTTGSTDRHASYQRSQLMVMDGPADSPEVRI